MSLFVLNIAGLAGYQACGQATPRLGAAGGHGKLSGEQMSGTLTIPYTVGPAGVTGELTG
jgi:hypothetical protein